MKTNYILKAFITLMLTAFIGNQASAQYRIVEVDPAADKITIKNFGSTTEDISAYRLCTLFDYEALSGLTVESGSLNLAPNDEVVLVASGYLNDTAADLGLYLPTGNFGTAANMLDFTQWGSGGNGRESVAVSKGIWTAGTFINVAPPYAFNGSATDFGVNFWETLLGVNDFETGSSFNLYPNPTRTVLNIELKNSATNVTYEVYDVLGKQILNQSLTSESLPQIDVSNLNSGLYLIRISLGDKTETKRFIKQ